MIISFHEEMSEITAAIELGARGFIPASLGLNAVVAAIRLASHGGVFIPTSSILQLRDRVAPEAAAGDDGGFTARQKAVAEALRRGKPNKLIAYELNMCESTVKVHIRRIMKKLEARNRTEASYKLNALFPHQAAEIVDDASVSQ
jgi:DNA-binding NarL/FixJ family response regulator